MDLEKEILTKRYQAFSDDDLIDRLTANTLTDVAKEIALAELARRGISVDLSHLSPAAADADSNQQSADFTTVYASDNILEAKVLQARLLSDGIPAYLADENTIRMNILWAGALGGARVRVPVDRVEEAKQILLEVKAGTLELPDEDATAVKPENPHKGKVVLWNPDIAALLSLIFSPLFGTVLHALNWQRLNEHRLARKSWIWFAYNLICILVVAISANPAHAEGLLRLTLLLNILLWYFGAARAQSKFVVKELDCDYIRASWINPACIAIVVLGGLIGLGRTLT